jgi:Tol biopolymer transport system component
LILRDGAGERQRLLETGGDNLLTDSFSPDGHRLMYHVQTAATGWDLWTLPLDLNDPGRPKPGKPELFLRTPADDALATFSPDGRWVAYRSNESGSDQIYVRPFPPGSGAQWQISNDGGQYAMWSNNGRELFYQTRWADRIMVLDYTVSGNSFVPGKARVWYNKQLLYRGGWNLDLAPDGKRFLVQYSPESAEAEKGSVHVTMLLNFFDELRRRIK